MLVLSRRVNEEIVIGDDIRIVVSRIAGEQVRLAIEAPKETPIYRREVLEAIERAAEDGRLYELEQDLDQEENRGK